MKQIAIIASSLFLTAIGRAQPRIVLPMGHTSPVTAAAFSNDEKYIVSASYDGSLKLWSNRTGHLLETYHSGSPISQFEISPDGKRILLNGIAAEDAQLLEFPSFKLIASLHPENKIYVSESIFSPDGKWIIMNSSDSTIHIFDAVDLKLKRTIIIPNRRIEFLTFSPDSKKIACVTDEITCTLLDFNTGKIITVIDSANHLFKTFSFSADSRKLTTWYQLTENDKYRVWDTKTGALISRSTARAFKRPKAVNRKGDRSITFNRRNFNNLDVNDTKRGNVLFTLSGHSAGIYSALYSPDGRKMVTTHYGGEIKIWEVNSMALLRTMQGYNLIKLFADFNQKVTRIVTNELDLWNIENGQRIYRFPATKFYCESIQVSKDYKILVARSSDSVKVFDIPTGKLKYSLPSVSESSIELKKLMLLSNDGKKIITRTSMFKKTNSVHDAEDGKILHTIKDTIDNEFGSWAGFSHDNQRIITVPNYGGSIKVWSAETGEFQFQTEDRKRVLGIQYSLDGKTMGAYYGNGTVEIWDSDSLKIKSSKQILRAEDTVKKVTSFNFSIRLSRIMLSFADGSVKNWYTNSGREIYTFFNVDSTDYLVYVPAGYYYTTQNAAKFIHYVIPDYKVITFEQLDVKYNRPDRVLQAIGSTDTALIRSYRKAWEKRIKKLGVDTTAFKDGFGVPEADFTDRATTIYEQKRGSLKLNIKAIDSVYLLERFNIWINEVPLFGQKGLNLKKRARNSFDTSINITLSEGINNIETSVANINGIESYRAPLTVNYTPVKAKPASIHFIGIGIDQFRDNKYNLRYSSKDIRDLASKLKEKYGNNIIIDTLFNQEVTKERVRSLKKRLLNTTVDDKVIVAYSGHGLLSKDYDYYLSTYSINFDKPEEMGLPYDELEDLLDNIPARKKLMLIDACHSGEVDKDDLVTLETSSDSLIKGLKPVAYKKDGQLGLKNSFELMQSLFVNVGKSTGATIISAAAGTQFALERGDLKNGVFTYSILEAMEKNKSMKISELKKIVGERVEQLTNGLQKPTSRNENIAVDWKLW